MRKKDETQTRPDTGGSSASRLTPADVQDKAFGSSFRGYNEREVDEFLDRVTEDLAWYIDENRKLRSQLASSGYVDPKEWGANAEAAAGDVLRRAKQEADRIVREAEARASAIATASATDQRTIVAPYLNRERDFLRSIGGLVQEHAEMIKAMVEEVRRRVEAESSPSAPAGRPSDEPDAEGSVEDASSPRPIVITDDDLGRPDAPPDAFDTRAAARSPGAATPSLEDDQRGSLRDLFWGNETH